MRTLLFKEMCVWAKSLDAQYVITCPEMENMETVISRPRARAAGLLLGDLGLLQWHTKMAKFR